MVQGFNIHGGDSEGASYYTDRLTIMDKHVSYSIDYLPCS